MKKYDYFCDYVSKSNYSLKRAFFNDYDKMIAFAKNINKSKKYNLGAYGLSPNIGKPNIKKIH